MSRLGIALYIAVPILIVAGFVFRVAQTEPVLANLGHTVIHESDFQRHIDSAYPPERAMQIRRESAARTLALEDYLDDLAIAEKAHRLGIDQEERFKKAVEFMEMKTLAQLVTERHRDNILKNSAVSPEELAEYYELHKHELSVEPRFTAHHLLVYVQGNPAFPEKGLPDALAKAKAKEALTWLRAGRSWQEIAQRYSDDVATRKTGGLIRDRQFGYFAPEVEQALRTQELGIPGSVIKTMFGYYVVEVNERITERIPKPFEEVREILKERLSIQRSAEARQAFMTPIWDEVGFKLTDAGKRDVSLLNEGALAPDEVLAEVAGKRITEADLRWFCKDALLPSQRMSAYSRPGARQGMLSSLLDMLVLKAKARKEGLDTAPEFLRSRATMLSKLLLEFLRERDKTGPTDQRWNSDDERRIAERVYLDRVRAEVGLSVKSAALDRDAQHFVGQ